MNPRYSCCLLVLCVLVLESQIPSTSGLFAGGPSSSSAPPPALTEQQKRRAVEALESSLLTMFGFSRRPRHKQGEIAIPQYMIDLYRMESGDLETDIPSIFSRRQGAVQSNTVRSFFHEGKYSLPWNSFYGSTFYGKKSVERNILLNVCTHDLRDTFPDLLN